jgi:hypothetical protein
MSNRTNTRIDWILTSNGPGEVSAYVKPIARELRRQFPKARITLILVPCQFASGQEITIARRIKELDRVLSPAEYRKILFDRKKLESLELNGKGAIIYLGGDPFHALLLKKRLGFPAYAYFEARLIRAKSFSEYFTPRNAGNLMVDSVDEHSLYAGHAFQEKELSVALFPGSRARYLEYMVPFITEVARKVHARVPQVTFYWGIPEQWRSLVTSKFPEEFKSFSLYAEGGKLDLMLTLVGTNTALYGIRGVPMLVLFPLNRPELAPLMGLAGLLTWIPLLGKLLQRIALAIAVKKIKYMAWPNMAAQREVTPELKGYLSTDLVADRCIQLLQDKSQRDRISAELRKAMGERGAAKYIVDRIAAREKFE